MNAMATSSDVAAKIIPLSPSNLRREPFEPLRRAPRRRRCSAGRSTSSAPGAATTWSSPTSATIDTPVSVWTPASLNFLPAHSDPSSILIQSIESPSMSCWTAAMLSAIREAPKQFRERARIVRIEVQLRHARVGIVGRVHEQVAPSGAMDEHADPNALRRHEVVTDADPGKCRRGDLGHRQSSRHGTSRSNSAAGVRLSATDPAECQYRTGRRGRRAELRRCQWSWSARTRSGAAPRLLGTRRRPLPRGRRAGPTPPLRYSARSHRTP